jgi:hypothetical protein
LVRFLGDHEDVEFVHSVFAMLVTFLLRSATTPFLQAVPSSAFSFFSSPLSTLLGFVLR